MEPWVPLVISCGIFLILLTVFKIARAYWTYAIPISFVLAVFCLVMMRRFQPTTVVDIYASNTTTPVTDNSVHYIIDIWYIIEASLMSLAVLVVAGLLIVVACRANPQAKCCVCCRLQRQIQGPIPYESIVFRPPASDVDVYVDQ